MWRWVAESISSLAMNTFVCSVKSYLEVGSRDYIVASKEFVFYLEVGLVTPQKEKKLEEKSFWK